MTNTIPDRLNIYGFPPDKHAAIHQTLTAKLGRRLEHWEPDQIELELSVKDPDTGQQRVTLEVWIAAKGRTRFVGTSEERDLDRAVIEVRDDVHRQIDRFLNKSESRR